MGTGYFNEIDIEIKGRIDEDVRSNSTERFRAELSLLCIQYGLDWGDKETDNAD